MKLDQPSFEDLKEMIEKSHSANAKVISDFMGQMNKRFDESVRSREELSEQVSSLDKKMTPIYLSWETAGRLGRWGMKLLIIVSIVVGIIVGLSQFFKPR